MILAALWELLCLVTVAKASITVHGQIPIRQTQAPTATAQDTSFTALAAYNDRVLRPPPIPSPPPANMFTVQLQREAANVQGLSMAHVGGAFFGFSLEMSVVNQVLGKNSSLIQVPFLNLMANLQERAGGVLIRMGGNTQEHATHVDFIDHGNAISKAQALLDQTTRTPAVIYTDDLFYIAANISSLVNVKWFLGIPFNDTANWRLAIAERGQTILGDNLLGLQAGNEPDLYLNNGHRQGTYTPYDYHNEVRNLIATMDDNPNIPNNYMLVGPSIEGLWQPQMLNNNYPSNNCFAQFGVGAARDPQEEFPNYLNHNAGINLIAEYLDSTRVAQQAGKPFIMFETNTASCGGFPGLSDSYGAALWAIDYGLQMAYSNFTHALLHVGGLNVYYNPFTAPPTNQSTYNEWTIGAIYYSTLVMAEILGKSNTSQVVDLASNYGNIFTPAYAIYEHGTLSKVALFNYVDDSTPASNLLVSLSVPGGGVPASVKVKYLAADSVSLKNITWAGQTFGGKYEVDGRLKGDLNIVNINCDMGRNVCQIPVAAPGFALVFFGDSETLNIGQSPVTFATTAYTKTMNTVTVDQDILATSNGHSEKDRSQMGSTSKGSNSGAQGLNTFVPVIFVLFSIAIGGVMVFLS
ncbi:glycoside hydrolase family 79 protein [Crucibulum laeve]|uniref:Glycoside hydrolase family 79 protein n=1 Tax=Crucibulum laeve TaxID=68775 RepID=A0A5C3LTP6_9AGAR|nr:glycoside hydrolase family 79 protein [Crucibulum laeve]